MAGSPGHTFGPCTCGAAIGSDGKCSSSGMTPAICGHRSFSTVPERDDRPDLLMELAVDIDDAEKRGDDIDPHWVDRIRSIALAGERTPEAFQASLFYSPVDPALNGGPTDA